MQPSLSKPSSNALVHLETVQQLEEFRLLNRDKLVLILFWASWYRECETMRGLMGDLCVDHQFVKFTWVSWLLLVTYALV